MTLTIHEPKTDVISRISRRMARLSDRHIIKPELERGLVSLSFDDCPKSVMENALPLIEAKGWKATIYASMGLCGTTNHLGLHMSELDMINAHASGHEIGDHSFSHIDGRQVGADAVLNDIARNRLTFAALGLPRAQTFAYPYGEVTPKLKKALKQEFPLLRGIHTPRGNSIDLGLAASAKLYSREIDKTLGLIEAAAKEKAWLILFGHDVRSNPSEFGCTSGELQKVLEQISTSNLDVLSVKEALRKVTS